LGVGDDLALFRRQLAAVAVAADRVDGFLAHTGASRGADLCGPHVGRLPLPHADQDGERAMLALHDALVTVEVAEPENPIGELRAVEEHAERPADIVEDLQDMIDGAVELGRDVALPGDRRNSRHDVSLSVYFGGPRRAPQASHGGSETARLAGPPL